MKKILPIVGVIGLCLLSQPKAFSAEKITIDNVCNESSAKLDLASLQSCVTQYQKSFQVIQSNLANGDLQMLGINFGDLQMGDLQMIEGDNLSDPKMISGDKLSDPKMINGDNLSDPKMISGDKLSDPKMIYK